MREVFWVTRAKDNLHGRVVRKLQAGADANILRDDLVELTTPPVQTVYPVPLRRVTALVEVDGEVREMIFLTNNVTGSAQTIADLYRCRWSIEIFFKELKQTGDDGCRQKRAARFANVPAPTRRVARPFWDRVGGCGFLFHALPCGRAQTRKPTFSYTSTLKPVSRQDNFQLIQTEEECSQHGFVKRFAGGIADGWPKLLRVKRTVWMRLTRVRTRASRNFNKKRFLRPEEPLAFHVTNLLLKRISFTLRIRLKSPG